MKSLSDRYLTLAQLPLLQGIGSTELLALEDAMRLDFDEYPAARSPLLRQGETVSQMLYLVEGELEREHKSTDGIYVCRSTLKAPAIIEADRLFGLTPKYQHTYFARTDVTLLNIRKSLLGSHLMKNEVFRLGMLNHLSTLAQRRAEAFLPRQTETAEERLKHFIGTLFYDCEGEVELAIQMKDLASYIHEARLTVSRLLNRWDRENVIRLGRAHFTIRDIQLLLQTQHAVNSFSAR